MGGRTETMLSVLGSPEGLDPESVTAMLSDDKGTQWSKEEINKLLALRVGSDGDAPGPGDDGPFSSTSVASLGSTMDSTMRQLQQQAGVDLKKNFLDMKKNVHKLGFGGVNLGSFGGSRKAGGSSGS